MASPVLPTQFCAAVPSSVGTVCEKLEGFFRTAQLNCTFYSWMMDASGGPSASFLAWLNLLSIPVGTVIWRPVSVVPTGYIQANGQTVSRTTYASLFAVYGTQFGAGDGSTTFAMPDLSGRILIGSGTGDAVGASNRSIGDKGGAEQITQTTAQMPAHTHPISSEKDAAGGGAGHYLDQLNQTGFTPADTTQATNSTGGGSPMNVMNPTMAGLWLVKF